MWRARELSTEPGRAEDRIEAARAVAEEHRAARRERTLACTRVSEVPGEPGLYRLDLRTPPDADWTWEGSTAQQHVGCEPEPGRGGAVRDGNRIDAWPEAPWRGEVVEVDDVAGALFVDVDPSGHAPGPTPGELVAKPFEFLAALAGVYREQASPALSERLARALAATRAGASAVALPDGARTALPGLERLWSRAWAVLWGPPGTGKTYTLGRQAAAELSREDGRRILIVSTTNKATDGAAIEVGRGLRERGASVERAGCARIGAGAQVERFERDALAAMLPGDLLDLRRQLGELRRRVAAGRDAADRAPLMRRARALARRIGQVSLLPFLDAETRLVAATCFTALRSLRTPEVEALLACGQAPFHTVIVDEAGLVSRAAAAALSLLAAERFVLVGDPRQLAPISSIARVLPTQRARWLAESALAHLDLDMSAAPGIHLLTEQHRMLPEIRTAVSRYQYGNRLCDAASVSRRALLEWRELDPPLRSVSRAIWYVLDEDGVAPAALRAERGPRGRSWVRAHGLRALERVFGAHPQLRQGPGLYVSPFRAQARAAHAWLARRAPGWTASTLHRQQGAEAEFVVFDTVYAGSHAWPHREWERLVNVGLSRARELVIVLASRDEMREPYLAPLAQWLAPLVLRRGVWHSVEARVTHRPSERIRASDPARLGAQLAARRGLRPVRTADQERLVALDLDSGPRLVRGVAGSGKTIILAGWLARAAAQAHPGGAPLWVLYGNLALRGLIVRWTEREWAALQGDAPFPWERVELWHVPEWLGTLALRFSVSFSDLGEYDLESRARRLLAALSESMREPLASGAFVDEAQDLGPGVLELCAALLPASAARERSHRPIRILYDDAQNLYGRSTPRWSALGLDMRGRSAVLGESFRGTRPIAELALNALYRLHDPGRDPAHREHESRGWIERSVRNGRPWWRARFATSGGPAPVFERFADRAPELNALAARLERWIGSEGVAPGDICVIVNRQTIRSAVVEALRRRLRPLRAHVVEQRSASFPERDDTLFVTTAHSYKGYEAEIVCLPGVDGFVTSAGRPLAHALYSALTRARSVLYVSGTDAPGTEASSLLDVLETASHDLDSGTRFE